MISTWGVGCEGTVLVGHDLSGQLVDKCAHFISFPTSKRKYFPEKTKTHRQGVLLNIFEALLALK